MQFIIIFFEMESFVPFNEQHFLAKHKILIENSPAKVNSNRFAVQSKDADGHHSLKFDTQTHSHSHVNIIQSEHVSIFDFSTNI